MRISIDINDCLMREAMRSIGVRTHKAAVEAGLRLIIDIHAQQSIRRLKGMVRWEGDLEPSRSKRRLGKRRG